MTGVSSNVTATDDKQVLIGLDLSAAFDIVDHRLFLAWLRWLQPYLEGRTQFIKMGQHESHTTEVDVGVPQGSVLGLLLFAVYCSPIADVIAHHGVQYHQYADDTQLHLAMRADNTPAGMSVLAECTLMSDSSTCRTVYSSTRNSQKL